MNPRTLRRRARAAGEPPKPPGRPPSAIKREPLTIRLAPAWRAWVRGEAERRGVTETALVEAALAAKYPELLAISDAGGAA